MWSRASNEKATRIECVELVNVDILLLMLADPLTGVLLALVDKNISKMRSWEDGL
jgi:hypothetical protein